jgi:hypothetical protein
VINRSLPSLILLHMLVTPVLATEAAKVEHQAEPAGFFLMVLGLAALLLGLRNLRDLRYKRMTPPRQRPHISEEDEKPASANTHEL